MEKMLGALISKGIEVRVCGSCINARGPKEEELVDGVIRGSMKILANWIKESDRVVSF
jgi:sulfur relay (sulfurtransferase) complex TusBCD TusD component (DsrE family)